MKLTVTITKEEIKRLIQCRLAADMEVDDVIVIDTNEKYTEIKNAMVGEFGQPPFPAHRKIEAIKFIRSLTGMGLADSKYAIENWDAWTTFVKDFNRFPQARLNGDKVIFF
jgi:ribosomal protein L7/L12